MCRGWDGGVHPDEGLLVFSTSTEDQLDLAIMEVRNLYGTVALHNNVGGS